MRGWTRPWGVLLSSGLALGVAVACNAILDNRDSTYVPDAGATAPACANGGYMCGRICVQPGNLAYGCGIDSDCRPCGFVHGTGACNGTSCVFAGCDQGYAHCSQDPTSGCETDTQTDGKNCGRCGNVCDTGSACSNGQCLQGCQPPNTACSTGCLNLDDPLNCGSSCSTERVCPPPVPGSNAYAVCDAGNCDYACAFPNGTYCPGEGTCADLLTDNSNCAFCGNKCPPGETCDNASCCVASGAPCGADSCCQGIYLGFCTPSGFCCGQPGDGCQTDSDCCSNVCQPSSVTGGTGSCL